MISHNIRRKIGQRIAFVLKQQGKKQKELAASIGVPDNVVSYFCAGARTPNIETLVEIANELDVSTDFLLGKTSDWNFRPTDTTLNAVCEYTGLSSAAATALYRSAEEPNGNEYLKAINALIEDKDNAELVIALHKRLSEKS